MKIDRVFNYINPFSSTRGADGKAAPRTRPTPRTDAALTARVAPERAAPTTAVTAKMAPRVSSNALGFMMHRERATETTTPFVQAHGGLPEHLAMPRSSLRAAGTASQPKKTVRFAKETTEGEKINSDQRLTEYRLRDGRVLQSTEGLAPPVRDAFIKKYDPVHQLGLTDDTVLLRVTERKFLNKNGLAGNPESAARILNHEAVVESAYVNTAAVFLGISEEDRKQLLADPVNHFQPAHMRATELADPSLNVMFGPAAEAGAKHYERDPDVVLVKMKLGDFRKAGGGKVFTDVSAVRGSPQSLALIVTLPEGKHVPVEVVANS